MNNQNEINFLTPIYELLRCKVKSFFSTMQHIVPNNP